MLRWSLRLGALVLAAAVAYLGFTFVQVFQASRRDGAERVQAIVVFGAAQYDGTPSPVLRARLDHAAKLYQKGYANR
nr:YdcF family protein [Actinomycetota bacterium]